MGYSSVGNPLAPVRLAARAAREIAKDPAKATRIARAFASDPVVTARALPRELWQRLGPRARYTEADWDDAWYEHLHDLLGAPWPCPETERIQKLLAEIGELLSAKGLGTGRHTYGWYSDAEAFLCYAMWCTVRHIQPDVVIETGVAHGVSSRVVLEALALNDRGHLWSIDLPHPLDHTLHSQTGAAVTDSCRPRWSYIEGESRRQLPRLISEVGRAQVFIHDSLHTAENALFEMEQAASVMLPGGVLLVDDIRGHRGFETFAKRYPGYRTLLCSTPDKIAGFGIAVSTEGS